MKNFTVALLFGSLLFGAIIQSSRPLLAAEGVKQYSTFSVLEKRAKRVTQAQREAAAQRAAAARAQAAQALGPQAAATLGMNMPMPGGAPNYFGPEPNWAFSPMPAGPVTGLILVGGGADYTAPVVAISDYFGTGSGAFATATVSGGVITALHLTHAGSGYTAPIVSITDAAGAGASAQATIAGGLVTGGIRKFVDTLPQVNAANNLGQYLPLAHPDTLTYPGSDYYEIAIVQYTEKVHSDLPPTLFRGYVQTNYGTDGGGHNTIAPAPAHYLGPIIVAQKDRPVRVKLTNMLPTGTAGDLFIPVDVTTMGAGMGPDGNMYTQNRGVVHLHGGKTPWISDGTPHQWIIPAGENATLTRGASTQDVPDMPDPGGDSVTLFWTNQQSARMIFYHDHAYGITRLNVYVGEAAGYLITDPTEQAMKSSGVLPATEIPLIIQDKSFVDANTIMTTDPTWAWGSMPGMPMTGDLWYPHVYMPNQNPNDIAGVNSVGRWDYGPWFWPPWPVTNQPITQQDGTKVPNLPNVSMTMETFMDTPVINGTAYPVLAVQPKAYRFRVLNAANDRFLNLQLYYAKSNAAMWNSNGTLHDANAGEISTVSAIPGVTWPAGWPTPDARDGGFPDPAAIGPPLIQIGSEGGFLPSPVVIASTPIGYDRDTRSITIGNIKEHGLLLGPAERADIIVDFSAVPAGSTLILYNDAPTPAPAIDVRLDYYTGHPDYTSTGGAPPTLPGYGPNTRTLMQIKVAGAASPAYSLSALRAAFASTASSDGVFAASQDPIIVPQAGYNSAYHGSFPSNNSAYVRIQDLSLTFTPLGATDPLTIDFSPKAIAEEFESAYGRMSGFLGVEVPFTNGQNQTTIWYDYMDPATEVIEDSITPLAPAAGDGTQLWKITHNGVDTHPIHFHLFDVQLINRVDWAGVVKAPDANELGWKETVRMNPLEDCIVALRPTAPKCPFGVPDSIRLLDPTMPEGSGMGFKNIDPNGNPITVTNEYTNFGWEYMWHCHILTHEEMDMMRPVIFNVARSLPAAPVLSAASAGTVGIDLSWSDATPATDPATWGNPANEIGFWIERAEVTGGVPGTYATIGHALANQITYGDTTAAIGTMFSYRVVAYNEAGDATSNAFTIDGTVTAPAAPSGLMATASALGVAPISVTLHWSDNSTNEAGFLIERADTGGFAQTAQVGSNVTSWSDATVLPSTAYTYRVRAYNAGGDSGYSNTAGATTLSNALPAAPTKIKIITGGQGFITLGWKDNSNNETGFEIRRGTTSASLALAVTAPPNTSRYQDLGLKRRTRYFYQVRAVNGFGASAWVPVKPVSGKTR
jgi:FtsP/CotA-like multicopper oxidase with cupredoxin domain